jgi:hypothetical protein
VLPCLTPSARIVHKHSTVLPRSYRCTMQRSFIASAVPWAMQPRATFSRASTSSTQRAAMLLRGQLYSHPAEPTCSPPSLISVPPVCSRLAILLAFFCISVQLRTFQISSPTQSCDMMQHCCLAVSTSDESFEQCLLQLSATVTLNQQGMSCTSTFMPCKHNKNTLCNLKRLHTLVSRTGALHQACIAMTARLSPAMACTHWEVLCRSLCLHVALVQL